MVVEAQNEREVETRISREEERSRDRKGRRDYGREFVEGRWPGTKRGNSRRV